MTDHCLIFAAQVNQQSANVLMAYLVDLQIAGATSLTIAITSPGGMVVNGISMYNTIRSVRYEVTTHNIGNVDSIANVIFLAGTRKLLNSTATFMFHGIGFDGNANERLEESNILAKLDAIRADHKRIASIISERSSLSLKTSVSLFKKQATKDAIWAVNSGVADAISEFKIPAHGNIEYIT
jgi:ATP-dependent Clp protease, protease subunit